MDGQVGQDFEDVLFVGDVAPRDVDGSVERALFGDSCLGFFGFGLSGRLRIVMHEVGGNFFLR